MEADRRELCPYLTTVSRSFSFGPQLPSTTFVAAPLYPIETSKEGQVTHARKPRLVLEGNGWCTARAKRRGGPGNIDSGTGGLTVGLSGGDGRIGQADGQKIVCLIAEHVDRWQYRLRLPTTPFFSTYVRRACLT